jgi:hypothetical protein
MDEKPYVTQLCPSGLRLMVKMLLIAFTGITPLLTFMLSN